MCAKHDMRAKQCLELIGIGEGCIEVGYGSESIIIRSKNSDARTRRDSRHHVLNARRVQCLNQ